MWSAGASSRRSPHGLARACSSHKAKRGSVSLVALPFSLHPPWTIFLYTNNHLRRFAPARKDFPRILGLRPHAAIFRHSPYRFRRHPERSCARLCLSRDFRGRATQSKDLSSMSPYTRSSFQGSSYCATTSSVTCSEREVPSGLPLASVAFPRMVMLVTPTGVTGTPGGAVVFL